MKKMLTIDGKLSGHEFSVFHDVRGVGVLLCPRSKKTVTIRKGMSIVLPNNGKQTLITFEEFINQDMLN